ncbi:TRAP-type C4-dicarboxylate transport system, small permease component [Leptothrix ochracea L12]|uniref:TRAP transporter small permease protein n=1 Tax=Leptothrix ochracea L12 TaxID=735332 RepID=I4Z4Y3_9BURK|nr:TRAP transporter small permease subunit [Leptothrix ochracea]EIM31275.1 TRAP-type C4-dicarboxylate transport system, small permease component [Leptothrix ochracea L12]
MNRLSRLRRRFQHGADGMAVGLFIALFTVFIVQISARFILDRPLPWTDELVMVLYLWIVLWGASFVLKEEEHVRFDLLYNLCPLACNAGCASLLTC